MPKPVRKLDYIPEIMYDAPAYEGQKTSPIPFMVIPKDKDMPIGLFILEYRKTGEMTIGDGGKPEEVEEGPFPHTYLEMNYMLETLQELFPELDMDKATRQIRSALGMKPTKEESAAAGAKLLDKVQSKETALEAKAKAEQKERIEKLAAIFKSAKKVPN